LPCGLSGDLIAKKFCELQKFMRRFLRSLGLLDKPEPIVFTSSLYSSVELESSSDSTPILVVKICGSIRPPEALPRTLVKITIADVTESTENPISVFASSKQWQLDESGKFCFISELGPMPASVTTLDNWTVIAQIHPNWLLLGRSGSRTLQFSISIFGFDNPIEAASSECTFMFDNPSPGYLDLQENSQRARILTVTLAFAIAASDGRPLENQIDLINQWARQNINPQDNSQKNKRQLERALMRTVSLLRSGSTIDARKVCLELDNIADQNVRCDAMEFCLLVAAAAPAVSEATLKLLKTMAGWLLIDNYTFTSVVQKILSVEACEVRDHQIFLGIHPAMNSEEMRLLLNEQYKKWSSRVTNLDPHIRNQAAQMLRFIAQTRTQFVK